jgi:hypothetical protein
VAAVAARGPVEGRAVAGADKCRDDLRPAKLAVVLHGSPLPALVVLVRPRHQ